MIIYLAADHAGFELKEKIKKYLNDSGYETKDFGAFKYDPDDDYPDFIFPAVKALADDVKNRVFDNRAVVLGGSGQGEAIIANRFPGVRAAVCDSSDRLEEKIKVWREHNDSNVLSLGSRFIDEASALSAVKMWLEIPFTGEPRHSRRLGKIDKL